MSRNNLTSDELISKCCGKTSYKIGSDWMQWGRHLGLSDSDLDNIGSDNKSCYEKADNVLKKWKQKYGNLSWEQLKKELKAFKRYDIVDEIEKEFVDELSIGKKKRYEAMDFDLSEQARKKIKKEPSHLITKFLFAFLALVIIFLFSKTEFAHLATMFLLLAVLVLFIISYLKYSKSDLPKLSANLKTFYLKFYEKISDLQPLSKATAYVDLTHKFVDLCIVDAVNTPMDAVFSSERENFLKKQMSYIPIPCSEVFMKEKSVILISGIAGIGKTWFLKKCLLDWSNGLIWKNIELVFYLECRRINQYPNISNINKLLNVFYKDIVIDIKISSHTALFIIDGLDEFKYFNELLNPSLNCNYPIVNALKEVQKYKHVIAGRVYAIDQYQSVYTEYIDKLIVQIMGFNENGINNYMENHVMKEKIEVVKDVLKMSPIAKAMASVPFYLSTMCKIISDSKKIDSSSFLTMTDLYANIFSYFMQKHIFKSNKLVYKIMEDRSNKIFILNICKIAYKMFVNNKIVFSKEEIQDFISDLDKNEGSLFGFIERIETDFGCYYQFVHLTMMEFCASVYAYNCLSSDEIMANEGLKSCLSMICGLANKNQNSFLKFFANLNSSKKYDESAILYSVLDRLNKSNDSKDFHHLFIECFNESQSSFTDEIKSIVDKRKRWSISIGKSSYETSCENYFVNYYLNSGRKLSELSVNKNALSDKEKKLFIQCSTNVSGVTFYCPINFEGWKPKHKIEKLIILISRYLITKKDFEQNFLPWINHCKKLNLYLHDDIDFIEEIYEWIRCSNIKQGWISYRELIRYCGKDFQ